MEKRRRVIINVILAVALAVSVLLTVWLGAREIADWLGGLQEMQDSGEDFGAGDHLLIGLFARFGIAMIAAAVLAAVSGYFNLRYLFLCKNKSRRNTVRNIAMLICAVLAVACHSLSFLPPYWTAVSSVFYAAIAVLLLLRIIYLFVRWRPAVR